MASGVFVSSRFSLAPAGYRSFANFPGGGETFVPLATRQPASGFACNATPAENYTGRVGSPRRWLVHGTAGPPTALLLKLRAIARYRTGSTPYPAGFEVHVAWQRNLREAPLAQ